MGGTAQGGAGDAGGVGGCYFDTLTLYDGADETAAPLGGPYCGRRLPPNSSTSGATAYVKFVSDASENKGGFALGWESHDRGGGCLKLSTSSELSVRLAQG